MRITVDKDEICTVSSKDDAVGDAVIKFLFETLALRSVGSSSSVYYWYRMTQTESIVNLWGKYGANV